LAAEMNIPEALVEKDYWVMHCLWGLNQQGWKYELKGGTSLSKGWSYTDRFSEDIDIKFIPNRKMNETGEKKPDIQARFHFYDHLAKEIKIPDIKVKRDQSFDDEKARSGGIVLKYSSHFRPIPELRPYVLLEMGFAKTAPNTPLLITSWIFEKSMEKNLPIRDNRAVDVKCFNPEYTFVDKIQTLCKKFRQYRSRQDPQKDNPREFLRHYYDLYILLDKKRVQNFIGTKNYEVYKKEKLRGKDLEEFESLEPFKINNKEIYHSFEASYRSISPLLLSTKPSFKDLINRIRKHASKL